MRLKLLLGTLLMGATVSAQAVLLQISVTNVAEDSDFFLTPLWVGLHDGSFDSFQNNQAVSAGIELLAEEGNPSVLGDEFAAATGGTGTAGLITAAGGFPGAPVLDPGETGTIILDIGDATASQFFSFASMVIPSNDAFIANQVATAYRIFEANGMFADPAVIEVLANEIWDAGTEVNNAMGAAFSALGGAGVDENGVARRNGLGNNSTGLRIFEGTGTAAGTTINNIPGRDSVVARISFAVVDVPEPGSLALIGLGLLGLAARSKRQR